MANDQNPDPRRGASALRGAVLVGVVDGQSPAVLRTAVRTAADLSTGLLVVHVAPDPYLLGEYVDSATGAVPISSGMLLSEELAHGKPPEFPLELRESVEAALADSGVEWALKAVVGEPALALSDAADGIDARMIVVGTRENGVLASIAEFLSGSVAVHLAHRQHRPVLVVPLPGRNGARSAPWDAE